LCPKNGAFVLLRMPLFATAPADRSFFIEGRFHRKSPEQEPSRQRELELPWT